MAKTATAELTEVYDELSVDSQSTWDQIGAHGYKPERRPDGTWYAISQNDETNVVGPADSLENLLARVDGSYEEDHPDGFLFDEIKEERRPKNQVVVPELRIPILDYQAYKEARIEALAKEVAAKKEVDRLLHDFKSSLAYDPATGIRSYRVNDIVVELVPGEDKLKSRRASEDDED
jgi:hypothetical protein